MANQEHLDILKQGVEQWNQWRREHPEIRPDLTRASLVDFNLNHADLRRGNFSRADLSRANLKGANFDKAYLQGANLTDADLSFARMSWVDLSRTNLNNTNFEQVVVLFTVIGDVDLSHAKGLETVKHQGRSTIGIDTIIRSQGKIPETFLRKAGVPSLIGSLSPIDYFTCFISHSSKDKEFIDRL
jgi:hypothetical protein